MCYDKIKDKKSNIKDINKKGRIHRANPAQFVFIDEFYL